MIGCGFRVNLFGSTYWRLPEVIVTWRIWGPQIEHGPNPATNPLRAFHGVSVDTCWPSTGFGPSIIDGSGRGKSATGSMSSRQA